MPMDGLVCVSVRVFAAQTAVYRKASNMTAAAAQNHLTVESSSSGSILIYDPNRIP